MNTYTLTCNGDVLNLHTTWTNGSNDLQGCTPVYVNFMSDKKLSFIRKIVYYLKRFKYRNL